MRGNADRLLAGVRAVRGRLRSRFGRPIPGRVWLGLVWVAAILQAAGCNPVQQAGGAPSPSLDPAAVAHVSLQAWAQPQLDALNPMPAYSIQAELMPGGDRLQGHMQVMVPNSDSVAWPDLSFRLYPNLPHYGAAIEVTQATVDGEPAAIEMEPDGRALRLQLSEPLAPSEQATVSMGFSVELPLRESGYTLFGWANGILSLPGFYPSLAVRDEGTGGWATQTPPLFADVLFNSLALYDLEFTAPADLTLVASGGTIETRSDAEGRQTWHILAGPVRDMTLLLSDGWESASETAAGATVTSYYPAGSEAAGQAALFDAAAALRLFSDLFGDYPYSEFKVVAAPLGARGMEYSGLVTIGQDLYGPRRNQLAFLVAHETAHQWWYAQVGNDPLAYPWLDEGMAEYAAFDYYRSVYGQAAAEDLLSARWQTPYSVAAARGIDGPVGQPASAMSAQNYELLAYAKAALFFNALRDSLGDETYLEVMRAYVQTYRWQVVTPQHFFGLAQSLTGANLNPLAEEWLR
jgi:hypothetical protein